MNVHYRLMVLVLFQYLLSYVKINSTRWIIKTIFSNQEISMFEWFTMEFIKSLTVTRILGLIAIASFTLITFPLGVWIGSFKLGLSRPMVYMITLGVGVFTQPLNFWIQSRALNEFIFNNQTLLGLCFLEVGYAVTVLGWYYIYLGNQGLII